VLVIKLAVLQSQLPSICTVVKDKINLWLLPEMTLELTFAELVGIIQRMVAEQESLTD
jgi:hypothetical protein